MRRLRVNSIICLLCTLAGFACSAGDRSVAQEIPVPREFYSTQPLPLPAQVLQPATCRLTLDEARQRALANNKALALARQNVQSKGFATTAATKDYFPKLIANATYLHFDNPLGSVLTTRGGVLPTTVSVNVLNQNTALTTVMIAQPITKLIAVNAAVRVARADQAIAQAKLDQGAQQVFSGVTQAYYGLIGARQIAAALQLQTTVLEQTANASLDARIALVQVQQGALQIEGQIRELSDQFNDLLDLPPGTVLELADSVPPPPPVTSVEQAMQLAVSSNAEIREAAQDVAKAEGGLRVARMAYVPDVNVFGGYANQTASSAIQPNINYVGVTASDTLWEWGKKRDIARQRESDVAVAHRNLQVVSNKVQLEARKTFGAFEQAQAAYGLAGDLVQACQAAERGAANQSAAVNARTATAKAQLDYMKAEIDYRLAHAQLSAAVGMQ